ncbi:mitochondrial RNA polymerase isoform X2 [Rhodnius prolixus]|uniref:mitochondrial RNA polymerase isoform X2 n=1 Tax=Rhodnius prolixus TaxID=13249 RepID=UPI003D18B912
MLRALQFGNISLGTYASVTKHHTRKRSTNVSTLYLDKLKKKKIKKKLYAELLEVSEDNASERRTKVKKINASNLSQLQRDNFIASTNDTQQLQEGFPILTDFETPEVKQLEELSKEKAAFDLEEVEEIEEVGNEPLEELTGEIRLDRNKMLTQEPLTDFSNRTEHKKTKKYSLNANVREALSKEKISELELAGKERSLAILLAAYIDVCVNCGFLNRAWVTLNNYLNYSNIKISDVKVFDLLYYGYAKSGNVEKLLELWKIMRNNNIKPSTLSFTHRIECIAKSSKHNKDELLNTTLRVMFDEGISINKLFVDTKWRGDSRETVLEAIRAVRPNFNPSVSKLALNYNNCLVNHLNKTEKLNVTSPAEGLLCTNELKLLFHEQLKKERDLYVQVKSIERSQSTELVTIYRDKLATLQSNWEKVIINAFQRDLAGLHSLQQNIRRCGYELNIYPYLTVLNASEYKDIIMNEIRKLAEGSDSYSPTISVLYRELGSQVRLRYENKVKCDEGLLNKLKGIYLEYSRWYLGPRADNCILGRHKWKTVAHKYQQGPSLEPDIPSWPPNVLLGIGKFLYNIIMREIKVDVNMLRKNSNQERLLPAFYTVYKYSNHAVKEEVKPHPLLARLLRGACLPYLSFNVTEVPMVIPPVPWNSLQSGGYVIAKTNFIRLPHQAVLQWKRLNEAPTSHLFPCFDSLNQLGSIPWKVNVPILDLVIKIFNDGGNSKLAIPESPSACPYQEPEQTPATQEEKYQAYKRRMLIRRKKAEMFSLWCDALYKLSLANHFRDKIFWLPHNMDFRGRVYPCPPHLNHLSSDMSRSLLCFAKGEPLGDKGLDWIKLHVVNLTGLKKRDSIDERLAYGNAVLPLIIDSADNPLTGKKWWMESEEPWQTLAGCMEIRNALQCPEGAENYISHFPVHQDGSCNGLQHYAALGRDAAGAYSVNLSPCEKPQDVYSCVAALVEKERLKDAAEGINIAQILDGFVKRKVIKQTVMTTVYGVTRFGGRLQIAKQLKDIDDFPKEHIWPASLYLVNKTFACLREMFSSTREIQDWLTESARLISQICGQNVEYVTPLGLPVVQPYSKPSKAIVNKNNYTTNLNCHYGMDMFERPNVMKQRNAFPPNFIHSLDSTHMMLTSLHCEKAGITFVSVHDCFWTHPKTVHIMNKICREQFVSLHSQPVLRNLSEFLVKKYSYTERENDFFDTPNIKAAKNNLNTFLKQVPQLGDFNLSEVLESVYFFS